VRSIVSLSRFGRLLKRTWIEGLAYPQVGEGREEENRNSGVGWRLGAYFAVCVGEGVPPPPGKEKNAKRAEVDGNVPPEQGTVTSVVVDGQVPTTDRGW